MTRGYLVAINVWDLCPLTRELHNEAAKQKGETLWCTLGYPPSTPPSERSCLE